LNFQWNLYRKIIWSWSPRLTDEEIPSLAPFRVMQMPFPYGSTFYGSPMNVVVRDASLRSFGTADFGISATNLTVRSVIIRSKLYSFLLFYYSEKKISVDFHLRAFPPPFLLRFVT
jgi:hypothetical protein